MNEIQTQKLNVMSALFDMMALLQDVPSLESLQDIGLLGLRMVKDIKDEEATAHTLQKQRL